MELRCLKYFYLLFINSILFKTIELNIEVGQFPSLLIIDLRRNLTYGMFVNERKRT